MSSLCLYGARTAFGSRRKCSTLGLGIVIFGVTLRIGLEEPEMLQHRMVGEAELAGDADALRLGLDALELDAVIELVDLDIVEHAEEVEMPPGAAELAVARELEPDLLLLRR